ncbi:MAG: EamA family transporter [Candidatus Eisenbacteria bacterium]|nr:EamA family transporter [Candidatus Eisenbacteria bacterium]
MTHIWILAVSILLNVCGQVSIKQSLLSYQARAGREAYFGLSTAVPMLTAPLTLLGLVLYAVSAVFWISALSRVQLSYAYPLLGVGYVLVAVASWHLWGESMGLQRILGTIVVAVGVYLVGTSGS